MTTLTQGRTVPEAIVRKLRQLVWRARLVVVLRGAMATLATAVCAVLAIMAIDYWVVIFSDVLRWAMSLSGLGLTVLVGLWFVARPLARSFTLAGVARLIESRHPELHERISSTVELLTTPDGPELRGSDALIAALAEEAVADARRVRTSREVNFRAAVPYLIASGVVVTVLLAVIAIWPDRADRLFRRALLANVSRVSRTALRLTRVSAPELVEWRRDGVDYVMLAGRRLHLELEVADEAVASAAVRTSRPEGGAESALAMTRLPDGPQGRRRFAVTCPPAERDFRFRLHAGDALTQYYAVRVVEQPSVSRIDLRYRYPAYTARDVEVRTSAAGDIAAVAGTVVTITARANKPLASAEFLLEGRTLPAQVSLDSGGMAACTFHVELTKDMKTRWSARLKDEYGFTSEPLEHAIRAVADARPEVQVAAPNTTRLKMRPTDRLPIAYRLKDDFGLVEGDLVADVDGRRQTPAPLPLPPAPEGMPLRGADGRTVLDLAALPLEGARQVTFRLRATDILPAELGGPQEGFSELFTIQLDVQAPTFAEQAVLAEELRLREALQKVLEDLQEAKKDSAPLRHMVPKAKTVTDAVVARVDRMRQHLGLADATLREAIQATAGGVFASFAEKLQALTDEHVAKALDLAGQIKLTDHPKQRSSLADEADFQVDRAIAVVNELLKELGVLTDQLAHALELQELAARQEELADALAEMQPPDANQTPQGDVPAGQPMDPEEWKKAQEALAGKLADMARRTPGALEAGIRRDQEKTKDLLAEAKKLAREQAELKQEAERATKAQKLADALQALSDRQQNLAKEAAAAPAAADQAKPMGDAADQIKSGKLDEAVGRQQSAETELGKRAEQGSQARAAADLAGQADQLARQQATLADRAEAAKKGLQKAEAQAQQAAQQAEQARQQAVRDQGKASQQAAELQRKQQALAEKAAQVHREAAANPPTAAAANRTQPRQAMEQAARDAARGSLDQAGAHAREAQQQAERLAQDIRNAADQAAKDASNAPKEQQAGKQKESQAAAQSARGARELADAQRGLADEFDQAAKAAGQQQAQACQAAQDAAAQEQAARQQGSAARQQAHSLAGEQQDVARRAGELAQRAAQAGPAAQAAAQQHNPTAEMRQAAQAMQQSQPPQAAEQAAQAAEKARRLADALRQAGDQAPKGAREQADRLADLSRKQAQLRQETQRLLAERKQIQDQTVQRELARLQREQAKLAEEAGKLADQVKNDAPQADRIETQAARMAKDAAEKLAARQTEPAAASASEAGRKLGEMAQRLGRQAASQVGQEDEPSGQPAGQQVAAEGSTAQEPQQVGTPEAGRAARKAALAEAAGDLSRRQDQLARQIQAAAQGDPTAMVAARQDGLTERTGELRRDVARIQEHAEELIPDEAPRREAAEAGRQLQRAQSAQGQAGQALQAGRPSEALGPAEQGAQALSAAAAALERLGRQLGEAAARNRSSEPAEDSQALAEAYATADQAAETQGLSDAALASQQLNALAEFAAARAQAMGLALSEMSSAQMAQMLARAGMSIDSKSGTGVQLTDLSAARLQKLGISLSDWARLPGSLRDQVLQAAEGGSPEEYRPLIRRYFREVAKRGGMATAGSEPGKGNGK